jgi:hypothetical protein
VNSIQEDIMDPIEENRDREEPRDKGVEDTDMPANPGINGKADPPDPDRTDPATLPTNADELDDPVSETRFGEHNIGPDHAEPTDVTGTTNDNSIDREYIDVGGGD